MDGFLNFFERKFGNWAIPGLIRYLAVIFFGTFLVGALNPDLAMALDLNFEKIQEGEYWRLLSFVLAPKSIAFGPASAICMFFGTILLFIFGDALEQQWGVFRTNLYVLGGYLGILAANLVTGYLFGVCMPLAGIFLGSSILFAFATYYPHFSIRLFFCIPCPVWIIAVANALFILKMAVYSPILLLFICVCFCNYLCVLVFSKLSQGKGAISRGKRRSSFRSAANSRSREPFHSCHACGANDISHPEMEFRVSRDGNDYCVDHLPE